jgi:hypothetical protein
MNSIFKTISTYLSPNKVMSSNGDESEDSEESHTIASRVRQRRPVEYVGEGGSDVDEDPNDEEDTESELEEDIALDEFDLDANELAALVSQVARENGTTPRHFLEKLFAKEMVSSVAPQQRPIRTVTAPIFG